jgi:FkbM family methyltransferase
LWVPDAETHLLRLRHGKPLIVGYQHDRIRAAMALQKRRRLAIDVGAFVGVLSLELCKHFRSVFAFEPSPEVFPCLVKNTAKCENLRRERCAIGEQSMALTIESNIEDGNTGNRQVSFGAGGAEVECRTLDSFQFEQVDLIKIDVQGFELAVLHGSIETLKKNKPVLIVEIEPRGALRQHFYEDHRAVDKLLTTLGYAVKKKIGNDHIYAHTS